MQFVIGTALAFLCSQPISGKNFFRVIFFIPLMITPLGVGYAFRCWPTSPRARSSRSGIGSGCGNLAWAADRLGGTLRSSSSATPGNGFPSSSSCMLAALENVPSDHVEAAQVDGASSVQIFREIIWPQIIPVAATVMLIRMIEAFKIVDLPNIMTSGGPGIATESMTLHSFFVWRANDFGIIGGGRLSAALS